MVGTPGKGEQEEMMKKRGAGPAQGNCPTWAFSKNTERKGVVAAFVSEPQG